MCQNMCQNLLRVGFYTFYPFFCFPACFLQYVPKHVPKPPSGWILYLFGLDFIPFPPRLSRECARLSNFAGNNRRRSRSALSNFAERAQRQTQLYIKNRKYAKNQEDVPNCQIEICKFPCFFRRAGLSWALWRALRAAHKRHLTFWNILLKNGEKTV